jgi:hypothetical protein
VIVVEAVTSVAPVAGSLVDAVHLLCTSSARIGPGPTPPPHDCAVARPGGRHGLAGGATVMKTELVADPRGPVVPSVLTVIGPDGGGSEFPVGHMPANKTPGP